MRYTATPHTIITATGKLAKASARHFAQRTAAREKAQRLAAQADDQAKLHRKHGAEHSPRVADDCRQLLGELWQQHHAAGITPKAHMQKISRLFDNLAPKETAQ